METLYRLRGITRKFGNRTVLDIDDLDLRAGRIYTLTGANGAGKSTLLQILALLQPPTSGEIIFCNEPVLRTKRTLRRLRRKVTLLHQSPYLFATSVFANVAFGLRARGVRGEALRRAVTEALESVGLEDFQGRKAQELSGGETQRIAMARALALRPAVLLLDEPLANVDQQSAEILEDLVVSLPKRGTTVVMITHDPQHLDRLGGESIHLAAGRTAELPSRLHLVGQRDG